MKNILVINSSYEANQSDNFNHKSVFPISISTSSQCEGTLTSVNIIVENTTSNNVNACLSSMDCASAIQNEEYMDFGSNVFSN